jgi:hypothetical protein
MMHAASESLENMKSNALVGAGRACVAWYAKPIVLLTAGFVVPLASAGISFTDRSATAKIDYIGESYGASFGDFNGDGFLDIYTSNHRLRDTLYLNRGNGAFHAIGSEVLPWRNRQRADTHGGTFADIDNDGDQDLLISTGTNNLSMLLYNENLRLVDRTVEKGITQLSVGGRLPVWLDYDGDKRLDYVMTQFGGGAKLYQQQPDGAFMDVTSLSRLVCTKFHYAHLFDANNDGAFDLLCPHQDVYPQRIFKLTTWPWTKIFESKSETSTWFPRVAGVVDSVVADFNNDGKQDLFLLSGTQLHPSAVAQGDDTTRFEALLANGAKGFRFVSNGQITFKVDWNRADREWEVVDLSKIQIGAKAVHPSTVNFTLDPSDPNVVGMPDEPTDVSQLPLIRIGYDPATRVWTLENRARLLPSDPSVFSVAYVQVESTSTISGLKASGLWPSDLPGRPTLLMNRSTRIPGTFVDETSQAGLEEAVSCASVTAGDFDNDMDIDLYLACRTGASNIPNILYENLGNGVFEEASNFGAAGPVGIAVGDGAGTADTVISGDYDVDGFLDLFVNNGLNLQPRGFGGPARLYRNNGNSNHWIQLDLVGTQTVREATGAKVYATAGGVTQLHVQNGGYHRWAQNSKRTHFGLAGNASVDLRVEWPSGTVQTFNDVAANRLYRITENSGIAAVQLGVAPVYPCGKPVINGAVDRGVFAWRDCATGVWSMKVWSANTSITYQGTITSASSFTSVKPQSVETNDVLDASNPKQIGFTFNSKGTGSDGVDFKLPDGANACLNVASPAGQQVFIGPFRVPLTQPLNLETQQGC